MKSDEELTILPKFKTRQWSIENSCGPNAALMIMNYFKDTKLSEKDVYKQVDCRGQHGTQLTSLIEFFKNRGYEVETSIEKNRNKDDKIFNTVIEFRDFVIENLRKGYPILVESVYYGGHYQVIIGYDKRNEDNFYHDILILADSSDETDERKDGYIYIEAYKFFSMWFDDRFFPTYQRIQPYILVKGKNKGS